MFFQSHSFILFNLVELPKDSDEKAQKPITKSWLRDFIVNIIRFVFITY